MGTTPLWVPLAVGLLAAAAMLVNTRVTAGAAARREREARRVEREAASLDELRDAALALRTAMIEVAARAAVPTGTADAGYDRTYYAFVVASQSVASERVRRAAEAWAAVAVAEFSMDPACDRGSVRVAWDALIAELSAARRNCV